MKKKDALKFLIDELNYALHSNNNKTSKFRLSDLTRSYSDSTDFHLYYNEYFEIVSDDYFSIRTLLTKFPVLDLSYFFQKKDLNNFYKIIKLTKCCLSINNINKVDEKILHELLEFLTYKFSWVKNEISVNDLDSLFNDLFHDINENYKSILENIYFLSLFEISSLHSTDDIETEETTLNLNSFVFDIINFLTLFNFTLKKTYLKLKSFNESIEHFKDYSANNKMITNYIYIYRRFPNESYIYYLQELKEYILLNKDKIKKDNLKSFSLKFIATNLYDFYNEIDFFDKLNISQYLNIENKGKIHIKDNIYFFDMEDIEIIFSNLNISKYSEDLVNVINESFKYRVIEFNKNHKKIELTENEIKIIDINSRI